MALLLPSEARFPGHSNEIRHHSCKVMNKYSCGKQLKFGLLGILLAILLQNCWVAGDYHFQSYRSELISSTCRVVSHRLGESCIARNPQRIIAMDQESLEILVSLGLHPIATTIPNRVGSKTAMLQAKTGEIANLGKEGSPNLEKIVQLDPDLIVGMFISPQVYELLSKIAPTVSVEYSQTEWKKTLRQVANLMNQSAKADELLSEYHQRVQRLRQQIAEKMGGLEITVMRFYTDVHLTQFLNQNSFVVSILEDLEIVTIPEHQRRQRQVPYSDWGYINISLEHLDLLESDIMFIALDPGSESSFLYYKESPLWQNLEVIKSDQVYFVDSGHWIFGNVLSAHAILDDLCQHLFQKKCP